MKIGWEIGLSESKDRNKIPTNSKVVDFVGEEQIFDYLYNQEKDAVFLHLYTPGHRMDLKFKRTV